MNDGRQLINSLYDPTTKLRYEGEVIKVPGTKTFQPQGEGKLFNRDGQVLYEGRFQEGYIAAGRFYSDKGQLVYEGEFKNGEFHGQGRLFDYEGNLDYEGFLKDGMPDGLGRSYLNGMVEFEGSFRGGLPDGLGRRYSSLGMEQGVFKDGTLVSPKNVDPAYIPPEPLARVVKYDGPVPVFEFPSLGQGPCNVEAAALMCNGNMVGKYMVPEGANNNLVNFFVDYHAGQKLDKDDSYSLSRWPNSPQAHIEDISNRLPDYYKARAAEYYPSVPADFLSRLTAAELKNLVLLNKGEDRAFSSAEIYELKENVARLIAEEKRLTSVPEVLDRHDAAQKQFAEADRSSLLRNVNRDAAALYDKSKLQLENIKAELSALRIPDREGFLQQSALHQQLKQSLPLANIGLSNLMKIAENALSGLEKINQDLSKQHYPRESIEITDYIIRGR